MARLYIEGEHGDAENFREAVGETPALHNFISRPEKINPLLMTQLLSQVINSIINLLCQLSHTRNKIINYNYMKKVDAVRSRGVELHRDVTTVVIVGDSILQPHPAVEGVLKNNIALTMCSHPRTKGTNGPTPSIKPPSTGWPPWNQIQFCYPWGRPGWLI